MSLIPLSEAKAFLDVFITDDDVKLQSLLDGAEREALDFLDREEFGSLPCASSSSESPSDPGMSDSTKTAIFFLLQSVYQANPDERAKLREAAEQMLMPYRCNLGA